MSFLTQNPPSNRVAKRSAAIDVAAPRPEPRRWTEPVDTLCFTSECQDPEISADRLVELFASSW